MIWTNEAEISGLSVEVAVVVPRIRTFEPTLIASVVVALPFRRIVVEAFVVTVDVDFVPAGSITNVEGTS